MNSAYRGESSRAGWTTEADYLGGQRTDPAKLARDLAETPGARIHVLREAGEMIACFWLEPLGDGKGAYVAMLTVRPDLQARGLGRRLLEAAEAEAARAGKTRMQLSVVQVRDTLIAWYQRRGYVLTGERRPFPYGDAQFGEPMRDDLEFVVLEKRL
ncbi:GNAT family N-acetyltransferase [Phenylobacterium sp. J367]|uniref:GNAT family N-acetyltransferase n=1 Tax=Phenylobacterium sp. J367 TaxID=2898435 RepID=UPI0027E2D69C|nr:GNAT family N-acetyltransferase [Phenylobacterium sp. J367]